MKRSFVPLIRGGGGGVIYLVILRITDESFSLLVLDPDSRPGTIPSWED